MSEHEQEFIAKVREMNNMTPEMALSFRAKTKMYKIFPFRSVKECPKCTAPRSTDGLEDIKFRKRWLVDDLVEEIPTCIAEGEEIGCLEVRCNACLFSWYEFCNDHEEVMAEQKKEKMLYCEEVVAEQKKEKMLSEKLKEWNRKKGAARCCLKNWGRI